MAFKVKINWPILQNDGKIDNAKLNLFHTARKVFNSFQTLFNHIQGCVGCQMKQKTSINMNLVLFCAKTQLELKNLQKCRKDTKIH